MVASVVGSWILFIFIVTAASRFGTLFPKFGLPLITGYLFVGAIGGPSVMGILAKEDLSSLSIVTQFALAFITMSAGAELYLPELRSLFKTILTQTVLLTILSFIVCTGAVYGLASVGMVPYLSDLNAGCQASISAAAGSIMVSLSPASSIALTKETKAKGKFTSTLLGVTVLCDVFVLPIFAISMNIAQAECKGEGFSGIALAVMLAALAGTFMIGWVIGKIIIWLMVFRRLPTRYLILPLGLGVFLLTTYISEVSMEAWGIALSFEPLLICITAGYVATNQSKHRHRFIMVLHQAGPIAFLPFFTLTGASLDLSILAKSIGFALIIALVRAVCIFISTASGSYFTKQPNLSSLCMWATLVTQAGVSLGLAAELGLAFPGWGRSFQTSIISVVLVNQIIGPVLFRFAIRRVGDAGKAGDLAEFNPDVAMPTAMVVGYTSDSMLLAVNLLKTRWQVILIAANENEAKAAMTEIKTYAEAARTHANREKTAVDKVLTLVSRPLRTVSARFQKLQDLAAGQGPEPETPPQEPAGKHEEHVGHEHGEAPQMETCFSALALLGNEVPAEEHPFFKDPSATSPASAAMPGTGATPEGMGGYDVLTAAMETTKSLQAVAVMLPTDTACVAACEAIVDVINASKKGSRLNSMRVLVKVHDPANAEMYANAGIVPLQSNIVDSLLATKAITSPPGRPLTVFPKVVDNADLSALMSKAVEAPHLWKFMDALPGSLQPAQPLHAWGNGAAAHKDASISARHSFRARSTSGINRSTSSQDHGGRVIAKLRNSLSGAELVSTWQRNAYVEQLDGLTENVSLQMGGTTDPATLLKNDMQLYGNLHAISEEFKGTPSTPVVEVELPIHRPVESPVTGVTHVPTSLAPPS
jgi:Kef-type K+ transport system membrane component KefB